MDINNLENIILNSNEETAQFINDLKLHDDFEQWYIFYKISRIKENKNMLLKNPSYLSYVKTNYSLFDNISDVRLYLQIMDVYGYSIQDLRDFAKRNKPFIVKIDSEVMNINKETIITFKTKLEAEQFIEDWNQLNELHRIIKFLNSNKIPYDDKNHHEVICREFFYINRDKKKDPIKSIKKMFNRDYTNEEIEAYWIMHQIIK